MSVIFGCGGTTHLFIGHDILLGFLFLWGPHSGVRVRRLSRRRVPMKKERESAARGMGDWRGGFYK